MLFVYFLCIDFIYHLASLVNKLLMISESQSLSQVRVVFKSVAFRTGYIGSKHLSQYYIIQEMTIHHRSSATATIIMHENLNIPLRD